MPTMALNMGILLVFVFCGMVWISVMILAAV
jgi:hypothetical protein